MSIKGVQSDRQKCHGFCFPQKTVPILTVVDAGVSKPPQLGCEPLVSKGGFPYTTARHHLISSKQCYARLKRCVRMGSMAGYDINDPPNGIALPTVANNLRYTVGSAVKEKYGQLGASEKEEVSFSVMKIEKAQWHVGHHAVTVEICENWADEEEDTPWRRGHLVSYDNEVIAQLLKILSKYDIPDPCDDTKPDKYKFDMDGLSAKIKKKLEKFKTDEPSASSPYFVSRLAYDFAVEASDKEDESW